MGILDIALVDDGVLHGGVNLRMAEDFLHLFDRHAFVDGSGGHGAAELVGVNARQIESTSEGSQAYLHAADAESGEWCGQGYKQGRVCIGALLQIPHQVYFGAGIEIDPSFLVALAEYDAFALFKIDIGNIEPHQLAHADTGGIQQVDDGQIPGSPAVVSHFFDKFVIFVKFFNI